MEEVFNAASFSDAALMEVLCQREVREGWCVSVTLEFYWSALPTLQKYSWYSNTVVGNPVVCIYKTAFMQLRNGPFTITM